MAYSLYDAAVTPCAQQLGALALLAVPVALVYLAFKSAREMHDGTRQLLESLADTVDLRDPYTGGHSRRVADLTVYVRQHHGERDLARQGRLSLDSTGGWQWW